MSTGTELIERHVASKKRLKLVRILGPLVLVMVVVAGIWSIVKLFQDLDTEVLTASLEQEAERVMPKVQERLMETFETLQPQVLAAFSAEQRELGPRLSARFDNEIRSIKTTLKTELEVKLAQALVTAQKAQRKALVKEFPTLKADVDAQNKILLGAKVGAENWAAKQMTGALNAHISAMEDIKDTLNAKFLSGSGEEPQQVMMTYLELMADTIGGDTTVINDNPEEPTKGKAKRPRKGKGGGK
ncbi:MAG: hypothetical protein ACI9WU_005347 [Myxococcota bacterium]